MIRFIQIWREDGIRVAICTYPFSRWGNLRWFLFASPLLRWAMGAKPGEKWWQGWWEWPKTGPFKGDFA